MKVEHPFTEASFHLGSYKHFSLDLMPFTSNFHYFEVLGRREENSDGVLPDVMTIHCG